MVIDGYVGQTSGLRFGSVYSHLLTCMHFVRYKLQWHLFQVVSLPVILTSQTSQEIMAKGTLIWDAAFSEQVTVVQLTENVFSTIT